MKLNLIATSRTRKAHFTGLVCSLVCIFIIQLTVCAQDNQVQGTLSGTVKDPSGFLIPGSSVSLLTSDLRLVGQTSTGEFGEFKFEKVSPGDYLIEVQAIGFNDRRIENVPVTADKPLSLEVVLELAGRADQAEVVGKRETSGAEAKLVPIEHPLEPPSFMREEVPQPSLLVRGRLYSDWFSIRTGSQFVNQLSNRVRMELGEPGLGWSARFDFRDRVTFGDFSSHRISFYDARISFDDIRHPLYASFGQMNLYDTAGIGELLGGVFGVRPSPRLLVGGYGGLRPDLYRTDIDPSFQKYGLFARYIGPKAQTFSGSFNQVRYSGETERSYLYFNGLTHAGNRAVLYGNVELELGSHIRSADRVSRTFLNARVDVNRRIDFIANYSAGKGLDFHRYLLERAQDPLGDRNELERFYYNTQYGVRLRYRLSDNWRLFVGQRISERRDLSIQNRTTQLGLSASRVRDLGISLYANYNINRGDDSESDSFYASISKTLGRHSWSTSYSTSFNGLRFNTSEGLPEVIHLASRSTLFNELFLVINRALALSFQYEHTFGLAEGEDHFFVRLILRM